MRKIFNIFKGVLAFALVVSLYAFSSLQYNAQPIVGVRLDFIGENTLYLSKSSVNKLLIQNQEPLECLSKEVIDLKGLESKLSSHDMIQSAEAYFTVNGEVRLEVEQRKPIARVVSDPPFYIDSYGKLMPLSPEHSARVMLVHGDIDDEKMNIVFNLIKEIQKDYFLNMNVTDVMINAESKLSMRMRTCDFDIYIGTFENMDQKFTNLKAFYKKTKKDNMLQQYKTVNLQFDQQVVCTKI